MEKESEKGIYISIYTRILEKAMASHSSTLAWKIPRTEEPGRLQSMGSLRVRLDWATSLSLFTSTLGGGNGNPLQCSCLENPRDGGAWWAAVYGVAQSRTRLKRLSSGILAELVHFAIHLKLTQCSKLTIIKTNFTLLQTQVSTFLVWHLSWTWVSCSTSHSVASSFTKMNITLVSTYKDVLKTSWMNMSEQIPKRVWCAVDIQQIRTIPISLSPLLCVTPFILSFVSLWSSQVLNGTQWCILCSIFNLVLFLCIFVKCSIRTFY